MPGLSPALARSVNRQRFRMVADRLASVARPTDAPQAHAPGINPDRVLVIGNGIAVGWGVLSHDLAIPGQLARRLSADTGRGIDVDLIADKDWGVQNLAVAVQGQDFSWYDAIVVVVGASDAFQLLDPTRWAAAMVSLVEALSGGSGGTPLTIVGIQPPSSVAAFKSKEGDIADDWAVHLNQLTMAICEGHHDVHYVPAPTDGALGTPDFDEEETRIRPPARYRAWADAIGASLVPILDRQSRADAPSHQVRNRPQSLERRLATLWELNLTDTPAEKRFDDIVHRAQELFGTTGAAFSIIDDHRQWNKSIVGFDAQEAPLENSFCATTIQHAEPLVVEDAWIDDRVPGIGAPMRFYAGYPVETADGTRIGALCVFSEEPRPADTVDVSLLRDLALAIQKELAIAS